MTRAEQELLRAQNIVKYYWFRYFLHIVVVSLDLFVLGIVAPFYCIGLGATYLLERREYRKGLLDRGEGVLELIYKPRKWKAVMQSRLDYRLKLKAKHDLQNQPKISHG